MSEHATVSLGKAHIEGAPIKALANTCLVGGLGIIVLAAVLGVGNMKQLGHSWLFSFLFFFSIVIGALFWVVLHHATQASWSTLVRRQFENLAALVPVLFGLFVPLIVLGPSVYKWMQPEIAATDHVLHEKALYLNPAFWWVRALLGFAFLGFLAYYYRKLSVEQDRDGCIVYSYRMRQWSCLWGLIGMFLLIFLAMDWVMSLDFHWFSHMFPVTFIGGAIAAGIATLILLVLGLRKGGLLPAVGVEHDQLMGKCLFGFALFWSWVAVVQFIFIWYANIPEETYFFMKRNVGSWSLVVVGIIVFKALVPFVLLLSQAGKRNAAVLGWAAGSFLLGHALDLYWHVLPQVHAKGWSPHWLDVLCWVGMLLVLGSFYLKNLISSAVYPLKDPKLRESVECYN